eukprot:CAMPEP_0179438960 /NCGR_PEP_ID=MMETSP0799-20121207/22613_1 /TAXON_ID=46947 /ORGANISM="Geminigera cryophila, Strain CCMP2564" /LENGTH=169 /DNA_ID=CAMNT_0021220939 /DNA_START=54 /DNA_END=563 /DNA_ORIENTATION=+
MVGAACAAVSPSSAITAFTTLPSMPRVAALRPVSSSCRAKVVTSAPAVRPVVMQMPGKSAGSKSGGSAVLDKPEVLSSPQEADKIAKDKMYHVLLFNDPMNTREYVSKIIVETFGHTKSKAYDIMNHAHTTGFAVCITTGKDEADGMSSKLTDANLMSSVVEANGNEDN